MDALVSCCSVQMLFRLISLPMPLFLKVSFVIKLVCIGPNFLVVLAMPHQDDLSSAGSIELLCC